jgi:predicted Zn-ribbon and HTH transcriptional regulator
MSDTHVNGAAHTPVNRVRAPKRQSGTADREATPGGAPPSGNGDDDRRDAAATAQGNSGRDGHGRFVRGNAGGPGNPFARRVAQLRRTLCETVTEEEMQEVAKKLVELARQGDVAAARLLLSYAVGQPTPAVDPDTLDLAEWDIHRRTPVNVAELRQFMGGIPMALICKIAGVLTPCLEARAADAMREVLTAEPAELPAAVARATQMMGCEVPDDVERDTPEELADEASTSGSVEPPVCPMCGPGAAANCTMEPRVCPICGPGSQERGREPTDPQGQADNRKHARKAQPAAQPARRRKEAPPDRAPSTNRANGAGGRRPAPA